ncbi:MAG: lytic transglycosylase domain-containing protein [Acidaminococcaceae bacterium]|nr:lytic transglycosylase domain-containing protein [Acidaminococcaceae bacterium]
MRKKRKSRHWLHAALLVCILFAVWQVWRSDAVQMRFVYLWPYQEEIIEYSRKNKLDPFLVAAVVKNESRFRIEAKSKPGAMGLMQIMPETGEWIAREMGFSDFSTERLLEAETNIRMGCWYLSELEHEFGTNRVLMLSAYNAGRGVTRRWMEDFRWSPDFGNIEAIPYSDTREYVKNVLYDRGQYYKLYKNRLVEY